MYILVISLHKNVGTRNYDIGYTPKSKHVNNLHVSGECKTLHNAHCDNFKFLHKGLVWPHDFKLNLGDHIDDIMKKWLNWFTKKINYFNVIVIIGTLLLISHEYIWILMEKNVGCYLTCEMWCEIL
jgi:hypothetical protein